VGDAPELDVVAVDVGREADQRWDELETACRLPADLYDRLAESGAFCQMVPSEHGGGGRTPLAWFDLGVTVASHSGSLGWIVTQGNALLTSAVVVADPGLRDELCGVPGVRIAGANTALGVIHSAGDRFELTGRWPFASGCEGADWLVGIGAPEGSRDRSEVRYVYAPASEMRIDRDWDTLGLRGTGSHSIVTDAVRCRADQLVQFSGEPQLDHPISIAAARYGPWLISTSVAATQLGIARRAIDEVTTIVQTKAPPPLFEPLSQSQSAQRTLGNLNGRWNALSGAVRDALGAMWDSGCQGIEPTLDQRCNLAVANHLANAGSVEIVAEAWKLAGTSGLARSHPLARCVRDVQPLLGHVSANERILDFAEQARRTGEPPPIPIV